MLVRSMLRAPSSRVSRVPATTTTWKGITEYSAREKDSNHTPVSTFIRLPPSEAAKPFST